MKQLYPLTYSQKSIYYTEKLYQGTSINNVVGTLKMQTDIDFDTLSKAINIFIKNNSGIRIKIIEKNGQPFQYIEDFAPLEFPILDFTDKDISDFFAWEEKEALIPFDFFGNYLFSFTLFKINEKEGGFLYKSNHIISDAWSMGIVGSSIVEIYSKLKENVEVENNIVSYEKHITDEGNYIKSEKFIKDETFWHEKLDKTLDATVLKLKKKDNISTKASRKTFVLPDKLYKKINEFSSKYNISAFALYMTSLSIYINRIMDKNRMVLGAMMLNRSGRIDKNTVGMFVNTIAFPIEITPNQCFLEYAKSLSLDLMSCMRHQSYPFEKIQKYVKNDHGITEGFCDIVVSYQNTKFLKNEFGIKYSTRWHFCGYQNNELTIHINDRDSEGKIIINYDYLTELFNEKEIQFIHEHIIRLLWHAIDTPNNNIDKLEMISENEKNKILNDFNDTYIDFERNSTIDQLFDKQLPKFADRVAIVDEGKKVTYAELNKRANSLASLLQEKGIGNEDIIGIMLPRSIDLVVAILGVLKAGGAYLPIDIEYPDDRKIFMLNDTKAKILITNKDNKLDKFNGEEIYIDELEIKDEIGFIEKKSLPNSLAYIIYTSGTTGTPKGVMIKHRSVLNLSKWFNKKYELDKNVNICQITNISFDVSVEEVLVTLLNGATIYVISREVVLDKHKFIEILNKYNINIAQFVPATLKELLLDSPKIQSLNVVICGGEELPIELKDKIISKGYNLYNHYGPTETTVDALTGKCEKGFVTLGKPISNAKCYILNKQYNLLPIGIEGDLFIGGEGVALGYLNYPEITKEKFIKSPFNDNEILYKTGDIAKWLPKGDVYFVGRKDHQVKINGHRIELYDIKLKILEYPGIDDVVVINSYDEEIDKKYIIAYIATKEEISVQVLRTFLLKHLPNYMIPRYFVFLNKIPLLENGKIDINSLQKREKIKEKREKYVAPQNEIEKILCDIWEGTLNLEKISTIDNVFDLGADSLTVIAVLSKLFQYNFGIKAQDIYTNPSIKELAQFIMSTKKNSSNKRDIINISHVNKRIIATTNVYSQNILLTGVTGFIGIHILRELLDKTTGKIYCLVRAIDKNTAIKRLEEVYKYYFDTKLSNRVEVICGDIIKDNLGLDIKQYTNIINNINHIIHVAAIVKPFGNYKDFYNVNVKGTENVLKLCDGKDIVFNYISSISVSGNYKVNEEDKIIEFSENDYDIGQDVDSNIYVKSKFEAEKLVLEARERNIKTNIFRLGTVINRFSDGKMQINLEENAFILRMYSLKELKCVSEELLNQEVDILPVDYVAEVIVALMRYYDSCFHILNNKFYLNDIINKINDLGYEITKVSDEEFQTRIVNIKNISQTLSGIINDFSEKGLLKYKSNIVTKDDETKEILQKLGIVFPDLDERYINFIVKSVNTVKNGVEAKSE